MGRKFILILAILVIETVLLVCKVLPVAAYQSIIISCVLGYFGANGVQKITQPREMVINLPNEEDESDDEPEYSPKDTAGFHN